MSLMDINKATIFAGGEMRFQCSYQYEAWFLLLSSGLLRRYKKKNVINDAIKHLNTLKLLSPLREKNSQVAK